MTHTVLRAQWRLRATIAALGAALSACGGGSSDQASSSTANDQGRFTPAATAITASSVEQSGGLVLIHPPSPTLPAASPVPAVKFHVSLAGVDTEYTPGSAQDLAQGTTPETAFKTIAKALRHLKKPTLADGQTYALLLRCGDGWREDLNLTNDNVNPNKKAKLLIGSYGTCSATQRPEVIGSDWIAPTINNTPAWTAPLNDFVYERSNIAAPVDQFLRDGIPQVKARYPNIVNNKATYLFVKPLSTASGSGFALNYDPQVLAASPELQKLKSGEYPLVGALVHVRLHPFEIATGRVTNFDRTTGVVTFEPWNVETKAVATDSQGNPKTAFSTPIQAHTGVIFEGLKWMADTAGEWAHDPATQKLFVKLPDLSATARDAYLANIEVSRRAYGVKLNKDIDLASVRVERLAFKHQGVSSIKLENGGTFEVSGIWSEYAQHYGVELWVTDSASTPFVESSEIKGAGNSGILARSTPKIRISDNRIIDTGLNGRAANSNGGISALQAASKNVPNAKAGPNDGAILNNYVRNSANNGLQFFNAKNLVVQGNRIASACVRLTDCGGIYTVGDGPYNANIVNPGDGTVVLPQPGEVRSKILDNVIVRATSDYSGYISKNANEAVGIYLDETTNSATVKGNRVSDTEVGIYLHVAFMNTIEANEVRRVSHASFKASQTRTARSLFGNTVKDNVFESHRSVTGLPTRVDPFTQQTRKEIVDLPENVVYAEIWNHPTDPESLFTPTEGNVSTNNKVVTFKNGQTPVWRRDARNLMSEGGRALWSLLKNGQSYKALQLDEWRTLAAPTDYEHVMALAYRQYALNVSPASLLQSSTEGPFPNWITTQQPPSFQVVGNTGTFTPQVDPTWAMSKPFQLTTTDDNDADLYMARYTVRNGSVPSTVKVLVWDYGTPATATYQKLGLDQPLMPLQADQSVKVEQFFWGHNWTAPGTATFDNARFGVNISAGNGRKIHLSDVSLVKLNASNVAVRPPMRDLTYHVVNLSWGSHTMNGCGAANLPHCVVMKDDNSFMDWQAGPLVVDAGKSIHFFWKDGVWSDQ